MNEPRRARCSSPVYAGWFGSATDTREGIHRTGMRLDSFGGVALAVRLDGALDETVYRPSTPVNGFIQQVPHAGADATEKTEVWVMFDAVHLY